MSDESYTLDDYVGELREIIAPTEVHLLHKNPDYTLVNNTVSSQYDVGKNLEIPVTVVEQ